MRPPITWARLTRAGGVATMSAMVGMPERPIDLPYPPEA